MEVQSARAQSGGKKMTKIRRRTVRTEGTGALCLRVQIDASGLLLAQVIYRDQCCNGSLGPGFDSSQSPLNHYR